MNRPVTVTLAGLVFSSVFFFVTIIALHADITSYTLGEADHWKNIKILQNVELTDGKRGYYDLQLVEASSDDAITHNNNMGNIASDTDRLLLTFENALFEEINGQTYRLHQIAPLIRGRPYFGTGSAIFTQNKKLVIDTFNGSALSQSEWENGFQIQFWLNNRGAGLYEQVLRWVSLSTPKDYDNDKNVEQISFMIKNQYAVWDIDGLFTQPDSTVQSFQLTSATEVMAREWQHHFLTYVPAYNAILYYIDGTLHDARYTTDNGNENGQRLQGEIAGNDGRLTIGGFYGALDQFSISNAKNIITDTIWDVGYYATPQINRYTKSEGLIESDVINLQDKSGRILSIGYDAEIPAYGEIVLFYRAFRSVSEITELSTKKWQRIENHVPLSTNVYANYIQLRAIMRADQLNDQNTMLSNITIRLDRLPPPLAVRSLSVIPRSNTSVLVRWRAPIDLYPTEYRVSYGLSPKHFTNSIEVGNTLNITLDSLQENSIYYIRVDSYRNEIPSFRNAQSAIISIRTGGD